MGGRDRAGRGGIRGLVALIDEHCEAFESDLRRYCGGVRLCDVFAGRVTWRELWSYFLGLPPESLTQTALSKYGEQHGPWSGIEHLLARVGDSVNYTNYLLRVANFQGDHPLPEPLPRPGVEGAQVIDLDIAREYLERVRAGHGQPRPIERG